MTVSVESSSSGTSSALLQAQDGERRFVIYGVSWKDYVALNDTLGVPGLRMCYLKKARGTLVGECRFDPETVLAPGPHELEATLTDASGDIVARAHAEWLVRRTD